MDVKSTSSGVLFLFSSLRGYVQEFIILLVIHPAFGRSNPALKKMSNQDRFVPHSPLVFENQLYADE
nr:hypothetical protein [Halobacillus sp. A1]